MEAQPPRTSHLASRISALQRTTEPIVARLDAHSPQTAAPNTTSPRRHTTVYAATRTIVVRMAATQKAVRAAGLLAGTTGVGSTPMPPRT